MAWLLVASFGIGAIPFAWIVARVLLGKDVRAHGSGNPGATNAARIAPPRLRPLVFASVFLLDAGKGYLAAGAFPGLFGDLPGAAPVLAGLAAVLGHAFTPFLRFRGGKGVATTFGVLFAVEPVAAGLSLAVFTAVYAATRVVAAGSLAVAVVLPLAVALRAPEPAVTMLAFALGAFILVRHRTNIARMLRRSGP